MKGNKIVNKIVREDINNICHEMLPWEKLYGKTILITGATGFLGSYITYVLLTLNIIYDAKIKIYAMCRSEEKYKKIFSDYLFDNNITCIQQDVCDAISDKYKCDLIIHAASLITPYAIECNPYSVIKTNVIAYNQLLEKAEKWGVSDICFFSSSSVYGYNSPQDGVSEYDQISSHIDCCEPRDVYGLSKQMCEMMSFCKAREMNCDWHIVRPFVVYGPGDLYKNRKAITDFIKYHIFDENIIIKSKGEAVRSYIYISDAISAFFSVLLKGDNKPYNIASEQNNYSIKELAELFCRVGNSRDIVYEYNEEQYLKTRTPYMIAKIDRLKMLGWKEKVSIKNGISRMLEWALQEEEYFFAE